MAKRYDALVIGGGVAGSSAAILLAARGLVGCARRETRVPAAQGLRRVHRGAEPRVARRARRRRRVSRAGGTAARASRRSTPATPSCTPTCRAYAAKRPCGRALGRERLDTLLLARAAELGADRLSALERRRRRAPRRRARVHARDEPRGRVGDGRGQRRWSTRTARGSRRRSPECGRVRSRMAPTCSRSKRTSCAPRSSRACCRCSRSKAATAAWCSATAASSRLHAACGATRCATREGSWRATPPGRPSKRCCGARAPACGARSMARSAWAPGSAWGRSARDGERFGASDGGFAVGNAAGEAHPIFGEGISMAMQGAFLLCARLELERDALLSGARQDATGRLYERAWRRAFGARIRWAALLAGLAMRPAARALLPALKAWPALLTAGAILGGKVRAAPVTSLSTRARAREQLERGSRAKVASAPAAHR